MPLSVRPRGTEKRTLVSNHLMRIARSTLSWIVALFGILLSLMAIMRVSRVPVFRDDLPPDWLQASVFALLALVPPLSIMFALRNRRQAGVLLLAASPLVGANWYLWFRSLDSRLPDSVLEYLIPSLCLAIPGTFFFLTARAGWPPLVSTRKKRLIAGSSLLVVWLFFGFLSAICQHDIWGERQGPCRDSSPVLFARKFPNHVTFTGRVVFAQNSYWCIMRAEHRYWGVPWWFPGFVVVRGYFRQGERGEYLVDGSRDGGLVLHFLPVVEPYPCCHTAPVEEAKADLRVLDTGGPKWGVRIVGTVHRGYYEFGHAFPGATVFIKGPGGIISATTDQEGIYDRAGLPPGHYTVQVDSGGPVDRHSYREGDVQPGEAWGGTLYALTYASPTAAPGR
jgi:hypothetical protein